MRKICLVFLSMILILSSVPSAAGVNQDIIFEEKVTSDFDVEFTVTFYSNMTVNIRAVNRGRYSRDTLYSLYIDRVSVAHINESLAPGESETWSHDFSKIPNPINVKQRVRFMIIGPNIEYTYNRSTSADDTDDVLMAKISEVNVKPAADGNGTELVVTVTDPSPHAYTKTLVVHSKESHRIFGHPTTGRNKSDTVRIPLNEEQGELVKGEIRLYSGDLFEANSTMDMVTFKGRTNGTTSSKEVEFERINDPANYYYGMENDSDEDELAVTNNGDVTNVGIAAGMLGAGVLALLSMFAVGIRRKLG